MLSGAPTRRAGLFRIVGGAILVVAAAMTVPLAEGEVAFGCAIFPGSEPGLPPAGASTPFTLFAEVGTTGPLLTPTNIDGAASTPLTATTSGPTATAARQTNGDPPAPIRFPLATPLNQTRYLDLAHPITGVLYWTTETVQQATADDVHVRLELWINEKLRGGDEAIFDVQGYYVYRNSYGGWGVFHFCFFPEVRVLTTSDTVELRVYQLAGTSGFAVGTAGSHQSKIDFRTFINDPLAGTIYLEDGGFYREEHAPPPVEATHPTGALALFLGLGLRRRGVVLAASVVLADCTQPSPGADVPTGTSGGPKEVQTGFENDSRLAELQVGAVRGFIRDRDKASQPVANVNVTVKGTNLAVRTDATGFFGFPRIPPGSYRLLFKQRDFEDLNETVHVYIGRISWLNLTLQRAEELPAGKRPHDHNDWGGKDFITLQSGEFFPRFETYSVSTQSGDVAWICDPSRHRCTAEVPLDHGIRILPGTVQVDATLDWTPNALGAKQLGLGFTSPLHSDAYSTPYYADDPQRLLPRGPGQTFQIPIYPNDADPGHTTMTTWSFRLLTPFTEMEEPSHYPFQSGGTITFTLAIHKGVVPLEPIHPDVWNGSTRVKIVDPATVGSKFCSLCTFPDSSTYWVPGAKALVPPGTKKLEGTLSWRASYGYIPSLTPWTVSAKPANVEVAHWREGLRMVSETARTSVSLTFELAVGDNESDPFYTGASLWRFYLDVDESRSSIPRQRGASLDSYPQPVLEVFAVKDPVWADPYAT